MRNITENELLSVYGGEIVVTAPRRFDYSIYQNSDGTFGDQNAEFLGRWSWLVGPIIEGVTGEVVETLIENMEDLSEEEAAARESKVAQTFDPSKAVPQEYWDKNGNVKHGWKVGDHFYADDNGNGKPDSITFVNASGEVWRNAGDGWVKTGQNN